MTAAGDVHRIVVGVDGSTSSPQALRWALRQARLTGARVEPVAAREMQPVIGWALADPDEGAEDRPPGALADCVARLFEDMCADVEVRRQVGHGQPEDVLLKAAEGAELVVVGARGHGPLAECVLGSAGQRCVHSARYPVVIVNEQTRALVD
ncbi:universal stress protein [Streptacidiphilus monticola]|uniref:Universal stress protein n=1 Tax=Streptacidiphilus monticola TaxID=2161674 RepID=A0ABW1G704_9ACTN